ncbi:MAG: methyltransferase domain-containing protein [Phycisphaerales bacterium]|nr:methyltransferase domain-containing protein [Phycisphaerales bacterium]
MTIVEGLDGRRAAAHAVTEVLAGVRFAGETLAALSTAGQLHGPALGRAMDIAYGTVRHLLTIERILAQVARFDPTRTPPAVRAILSTAAFELLWRSGTPHYAAVNEAVNLARRVVRGRAPGMVNAVLRRLAATCPETDLVPWVRHDPTLIRMGWNLARRLVLAVLPTADARDGFLAHTAAATGLRASHYAGWVTRYGAAPAEAAAWASQAVPPIVLQRHKLRASEDQFRATCGANYGELVEFADDAAYFAPTVPIATVPAFEDGLGYVQDTTAHAAALALEPQPGERILDLCAAPGGKTIALACAAQDGARILATDIAPDRLRRIRENVERLKLTSIEVGVVSADGRELLAEAGQFDAALVDVPCSNTGVLARRPEARLGFRSSKLAALVAVQAELLTRAARCIRPGGRLVYSTCSIEPAENEEVVAAFVAAHPAWHVVAEQVTLPTWGPARALWRDGGYWARLVQAP